MKEYILKLKPEELQMLSRQLGEMKHIYGILAQNCGDDEEFKEIKQMYLTYIDEVEQLIKLLFTVFKELKDESNWYY